MSADEHPLADEPAQPPPASGIDLARAALSAARRQAQTRQAGSTAGANPPATPASATRAPGRTATRERSGP